MKVKVIVDEDDDNAFCTFELKNEKKFKSTLVKGKEVSILKTNINKIIT